MECGEWTVVCTVVSRLVPICYVGDCMMRTIDAISYTSAMVQLHNDPHTMLMLMMSEHNRDYDEHYVVKPIYCLKPS